MSELLKSVGEASKSWGELKANDLNNIRKELNELLGEQPYKIVIVIDDIDRLNKDNDGLITFIVSFLQRSESYGESDLVRRVDWRIHTEGVGKFVNLGEVEERIRNIFSSSVYDNLEDREKIAIRVFLDAIDRKIRY